MCSRNHCCCAKARCISYSVGGCVALVFKKESTCVILYYRLWLVRVYEIFPHNLIKGTIFGKTGVICSIKKIVFFLFSLKILSGIFMILPRIQWDIVINVRRSSCKVPVIIVRFLMKLEISQQIIKTLIYHISWKSVHWAPSYSGSTDRHDNVNRFFFQLGESALKLKRIEFLYSGI